MSGSRPDVGRITSKHLRLLRDLTQAIGVSGDEAAVREIIRREILSAMDDLWTDSLGNLLAVRRGRGRKRLKVMLTAHMDEVGFMITDVGHDGFLEFRQVGGVDRKQVPGKRLWLGQARHLGVIGTTPIHLTQPSGRTPEFSIESLRVDIGAGSRQSALERVQPGDRATFATVFRRQAGALFAKALDDRLGVATLIELARAPSDTIDLMAAFTAREEIDHSGAQVAAQALDPDLAIVLEATPARDLPTSDGAESHSYNTRLGQGPAIYLADRKTISDSRLFSIFLETAKRTRRPYQIRQPGGGSTDASVIHLANGGVPTIAVSVPVRNIHGPVGLAMIADWRSSVALVHQVLATLAPAMIRRH